MLQNDTPQSRKKVQLLGSILLVPVIIWFFQGYFLSSLILQHPVRTAVLVGVVLAFLIFLLERAIIMVNSSNWKIYVFRIMLGFLIAAIGSVVLDEIVFHNDINNHMTQYKKQKLDSQLAIIDQTYQEGLKDLESDALMKFELWTQALEEVKAEADGTGGSGIRGVSEITKVKMTLTHEQQKVFENTQKTLGLLEAKKESEKSALRDSFQEEFSGNSLLTRIKVMFDFIRTDLAMLIMWILFTLFLFFMEFLVVIIKTVYPETNYEKKVKMIEEVGENRMKRILERELRVFNPAGESDRAIQSRRLVENGRLKHFIG